jgi:hypothetical protein
VLRKGRIFAIDHCWGFVIVEPCESCNELVLYRGIPRVAEGTSGTVENVSEETKTPEIVPGGTPPSSGG